MAGYSVDLRRTSSTSASVGTIGADGTRPRRGIVHDIIIGSEATPADAAIRWLIQRCTALGTSTAVTPVALDPGSAATEADCGENHTVEP
ncbi:MAG TPA: hypothetical protein VEJ18_11895, partial [Planctomycetota bacterium]|nr:hypothetical protein [Planctomycetota bacterium]